MSEQEYQHRICTARQLFPLGKCVFTAGVAEILEPKDIHHLIYRHAHGDFGDLCVDDVDANHRALDEKNPSRILSCYDVEDEKVYVITEWNRSVTTVLLSEEV
jgi:hypothetical protein